MTSRCNSCKHYQIHNEICFRCGANNTLFDVTEIDILADIANILREETKK